MGRSRNSRERSNARRWTRDELLVAMNLYCRISFGRQHSRAPEVIQLAAALDRTPSSVAMKLNNFTSLDPAERERGVEGLPGASRLDREVWDAFHVDWTELAAQSEILWNRLLAGPQTATADASAAEPPATPEDEEPAAPTVARATEAHRVVRVRLAQSFFRRVVIAAYESACCITGNPVPELLDAAHIVPWSARPEHRANPRNGLCLSRLHHAALDQGLITFDGDHRLVLSRRLRAYLPDDALDAAFVRYEGHPLRLPERFLPSADLLAFHREHVFVA